MNTDFIKENPKTSIVGVVPVVALVAKSVFGVDVPVEAVSAIAVFLIGLFAKDGGAKNG